MGLFMQQDGDNVPYTPAAAVSAGDVVRLPDGRSGIAQRPIAANVTGDVRVKGVFNGPAASADTWSRGAVLVWDPDAGEIKAKALTYDADEAFVLGTAWAAKTNGQTTAAAQLNEGPKNQGIVTSEVVYEFDCQTGVDTDPHILIPAEKNPHGLLILAAYGVVTEQMAGSSQDQGIVTIEDGDGNAIQTITAADSAADAIGDILVGTLSAVHASSGAVAPVIPAGKAVQGQVTQVTAGGSPAGKIKVYVIAVPLL